MPRIPRIPRIPPIFHVNKYVTDFKDKAELFNMLLTNQCTLINNCLASNYMFKNNNRNTKTSAKYGVVLVSLLLILSISHTLFYCFYC